MKYLFKLFIIITLFAAHALAQWSNDPSLNTQVSLSYTIAGSGGEYAKSVSDNSGGVIIVWVGEHTNGQAIFAQRLNANGIRIWGDSGVVVSDTINSQFNPVLVSDGTGGAIIAWEDWRSGVYIHIYAQRVDSDGNLLWPTTNGVPVCTTNSDKQYLQIASDNNNGAYIVWVDSPAGFTEPDIYAQRLDQNGNLIGPTSGIPICTETNYQIDPAIISSDVQGNAIISWIDQRASILNYEIYAQKIDLTGSIQWISNGIKVSDNNFDFFLENNSICSDENGGAILAWSSYGFNGTGIDIFAQRISSNGDILWTPPANEQGIPVCNELDEQNYPVITSDGSGGAIIAWSDRRSGSTHSIYAQKINQNGSSFWTPQGELICDNTYSDFDDIQIVATSSGGAIICWSDNRDLSTNSLDIYAQLISQFGATQWNYSGNVISNDTLQQAFPNIINDGFDNAIICWPDDREYVYAQRILNNGLFLLPNNVDGIISIEEYGSHVEGENMFTSDGRTWYMSWTADSLYIGISSFDDPNDALIVYLDTKVDLPVNLNDVTNGNLIGNGESGAIEPQLPFTSDFYLYYSPTNGAYFKKPDGSGGWEPFYYSSFNYTYNAANQVIELSVAWSDINPVFQVSGGEFNWLGAISNIGAFPAETYSRVPAQNPQGIFPEFTWYYTVRFTGGLGIPAFPFASVSFAYRYSSLTINNQLDCFDFTLNSPLQTIERTSGEWNINGRMVINDGELNFLNNNDIKIKENYIQLGGEVSFNNANVFVGLNCLYYGGNINLNPGQTFILDGLFGGILEGPFPFSNLTINKSQFLGTTNVNAWSDQRVNGTLTLQQGNLIMEGPPPSYTPYKLTLGPGGNIAGGGFIQGAVEIAIPSSPNALPKGDGIENYQVTFPVGTSNGSSPVTLDFSSVTTGGNVTVQAFQSVQPNSVIQNQSAQRYWSITKDNDLAFTSANVTFNYRPEDFNTAFFEATDEGTMVVGKYDSGNWTFPTVLSRSVGGNNDGGSITVSGITSFSDFTFAKSEAALPVELTSFTAYIKDKSVNLKWVTATEINNFGFEIERSVKSAEEKYLNWEKIGFVSGSGNSNSEKSYSFTDSYPSGGSRFIYRLKQIDNDGSFEYSSEIEVELIPAKFELSQNYPNPFNPSTTISFSIPKEEIVSLKVYNSLGEEVAELINETKQAGNYEINFNAAGLASGIYFYKIQAGSFTQTKKMTILK